MSPRQIDHRVEDLLFEESELNGSTTTYLRHRPYF